MKISQLLSVQLLQFAAAIPQTPRAPGQGSLLSSTTTNVLLDRRGDATSSSGGGAPQYTTIAGVSVIDTPLVRAAQKLARAHSNDIVYNHVMRGWLFGVLFIESNEALQQAGIDLEAHAVAALLHDLGWDQTPESPFVSPDRRFEVDGAIAARAFVQSNLDLASGQGSGGSDKWDAHRLQLVWDSIALHTQPPIFQYKEPEVLVTGSGIGADFSGPEFFGINATAYAAVEAVFPNNEFKEGVNETIVWLCETKPATTYDTWMQPWGEHFVANYSTKGGTFFDQILYEDNLP
ncbi:hypothetical protein BX600DRAFT_503180 [Xylariales sp. PMI_506]|nr:hypothetical protein BX600DRAFT_503180 [Xylariales sp. PMI_506]